MATPYQIAAGMAGSREGQAALTDYLRTGGQNIDPQTRAWCADFVNATLSKAGQKGTDSGMARSFLQWGQEVADPQQGDIAVFSRGDPSGPSGHVGFFAGKNPDGTIKVLGGNQSDSVSYASYPAERLLGYRRPGGPTPSSPAGGALAASQIQPPLPPEDMMVAGSDGPQQTPFSISPEVAKYATSGEPKTFGNRLSDAAKWLEADKPPAAPKIASMGGAGDSGNALAKVMENPTSVADALLKRRMPFAFG